MGPGQVGFSLCTPAGDSSHFWSHPRSWRACGRCYYLCLLTQTVSHKALALPLCLPDSKKALS